MENPFDRFEDRRRKREFRRLELNKELAALAAEGERDAIAVAQLRAVYPNGFPERGADTIGVDALETAPAPPAASAAQMQARGGDMTVKDMALAVLRDASPNGLSASQIKGKAFLRFKKHINPNTLTVSLVRLKPQVRCEGRVWYYESPPVNGEDREMKETGYSAPNFFEGTPPVCIGGGASGAYLGLATRDASLAV